MKRYLYIFFLLLLFVFSALEATKTRSLGAGITGDFTWAVDDQFTYIYLNPAYVTNYSSIFFAEYSIENSIDKKSGGVILKPFENFSLGIVSGLSVNDDVLNNDSYPRSLFKRDVNAILGNTNILLFNQAVINANGLSLAEGVALFQNSRNILDNRNLTVLIGWRPTKNFSIGVNSSYSYSIDSEVKTRQISENFDLFKSELRVSAGLAYFLNDRYLKSIDLSTSYTRYVIDNSYDETDLDGKRIMANYKTSGAYDLSVGLRFVAEVIPKHRFHLSLNYDTYDTSTTGTALSQISNLPSFPFSVIEDYSRVGSKVNFGFSDQLQILPNVMIFAATFIEISSFVNNYDGRDLVSLTYRPDPVKEEYSSTRIPILMGLEGRLFKNWIFRFGFSHAIKTAKASGFDTITYNYSRADTSVETITQEDIKESTGSAGASSNISMGLSYFLPSLQIDWKGNILFFSQGPFLLSGQSAQLATSVAITFYLSKLEEFTR